MTTEPNAGRLTWILVASISNRERCGFHVYGMTTQVEVVGDHRLTTDPSMITRMVSADPARQVVVAGGTKVHDVHFQRATVRGAGAAAETPVAAERAPEGVVACAGEATTGPIRVHITATAAMIRRTRPPPVVRPWCHGNALDRVSVRANVAQ